MRIHDVSSIFLCSLFLMTSGCVYPYDYRFDDLVAASREIKCDCTEGCADGSDEAGCGSNTDCVTCGDGKMKPPDDERDGEQDCDNGSDEAGCQRSMNLQCERRGYPHLHDSTELNGSGYSCNTLSGNILEETFIVIKGENKDGYLDSRVERRLSPPIYPNKRRDYVFKGFFIFDEAKDTTFLQILNTDMSSNDEHVPVFFLEASLTGDRLVICDGRCNKGGKRLLEKARDNNVHVRVTTNGTTATVTFDEKQEYVKRFSRLGDLNHIRYGTYHHHRGYNPSEGIHEAWSTAKVRVRGARYYTL